MCRCVFFPSLFDVAFHNSRAAQRMANNNAPVRTRVPDLPNAERGGFCGALQRIQPPMPAGMARRLANKENYGLGKVSVVSHRFGCFIFYAPVFQFAHFHITLSTIFCTIIFGFTQVDIVWFNSTQAISSMVEHFRNCA